MNIDDKAWNEWLANPVTRATAAALSVQYGAELRSCAAAVRKGDGSEHLIAGRIEMLESILSRFKVVAADVQIGSAYDDAGDVVDNRPDPATVANWQDSTMGRT